MNPLHYRPAFDSAIVGFEFEFYSKLRREEIAKALGALVKKRISVKKSYHSSAAPGEWKIEPDFSGGVLMHELVTAPMPFNEAMLALSRILAWMKGACWTDEKCAMQFSVSFDREKSRLRSQIESVNRLKFVLGYDEDYVYQRFPKRKNSTYARSISTIIPVNKFQNSYDTALNQYNYELPDDKFYGVNFGKLARGYIEFRYLGGKGYEKKPSQIREIVEYSVGFLYDTLDRPEYDANDITKLKVAMTQHKKIAASFADPQRFLMEYPNINVMVNLNGDMQTLQTYWVHIREKLFDLIVRCGMRTGMVNYDSDVAKYQVKDANIPTAFSLVGWEVVDCKVRGNIIDCDLYMCDISSAHVVDCKVLRGTTVRNSKVQTSHVHPGAEIEDSYVDNRDKLVSGRMVRCVIRSGNVTENAEIVECELIYKLLGLAKSGGAMDPKDVADQGPGYWDKMSGDKGGKKMGAVLAGYVGGSEIPVEKGDPKKSAGKVLIMPGLPVEKSGKK